MLAVKVIVMPLFRIAGACSAVGKREKGERRKKGHTNNCTYISHELVFDVSVVYVQEDKTGHCVRGSFHIPPNQVPDPGRGRRKEGRTQRMCDKRARAVREAWRFDHAWGASLYIYCDITDRSRN